MEKNKKVFAIMPFSDPFNSYYEEIYKPALEKCRYFVKRVDEIPGPKAIITDIQKAIWQSDLILCEMSTHNPNVFYELGLAHAIGKPVILISNKDKALQQVKFIFYNALRLFLLNKRCRPLLPVNPIRHDNGNEHLHFRRL